MARWRIAETVMDTEAQEREKGLEERMKRIGALRERLGCVVACTVKKRG